LTSPQKGTKYARSKESMLEYQIVVGLKNRNFDLVRPSEFHRATNLNGKKILFNGKKSFFSIELSGL
jgi:hypothetical protein